MNLYEIKEEFLTLLDAIANGEIPDEAVADTLESMKGEFDEKIENTACYIKNLKAETDAIKAEENSLKERRQAKEHHIERLKNGMMECMSHLGIKKVEGARARVTMSTRAGASVLISPDAVIPEEYQRTKVEPDKTALKEALKAGVDIKGVTLVDSRSVTIK